MPSLEQQIQDLKARVAQLETTATAAAAQGNQPVLVWDVGKWDQCVWGDEVLVWDYGRWDECVWG